MSDESDPIIQLDRVTHTYTRGGESLRVLDEFSLDFERHSFYSLMGPSGSGKTTLLNLVGGLDQPTSGSVIVDGVDVGRLGSADLSRWRADTIGFVFQGFNLLPVLTALENVLLPLSLTPLAASKRREHAEFALELVGLKDRMKHMPSQLSGGQEQRVAIARAIVTDPRLLLADEPTGDLDRATADQILELMTRLNSEHGKAIVMVTHDPLAAAYAGKVIHLDKGKLGRIEVNPPREQSGHAASAAGEAV